MSQLPILKLATHIVASVGVSKVVNDMISNNVNSPQTTADAVKLWTGSIVIGSMVAEQASKHVSTRFDELAAWYASRKADTAAA
jgi:hypothetical protein